MVRWESGGGGYSLQEHDPVQRLGSLQKEIPAAALPQKAPAPWLPQAEPHKAQPRGQQEEEAAQMVLWGQISWWDGVRGSRALGLEGVSPEAIKTTSIRNQQGLGAE